jgi:hypothetical protein
VSLCVFRAPLHDTCASISFDENAGRKSKETLESAPSPFVKSISSILLVIALRASKLFLQEDKEKTINNIPIKDVCPFHSQNIDLPNSFIVSHLRRLAKHFPSS